MTFYRRLVKHIFRKDRFKADPHNDNFYLANIPLKVNKNQYDMLIDSEILGLNMDELDELVEEVLMQSKKDEHTIPQVLFDYYRQEIISSLPNFTNTIFLSIIAVIVILLFNQYLHFSKLTYSAMIFFAIIIICCISYAMTYHDCLNDLEVEQMILLSKEQNNPCTDYHGERESIWAFIPALFQKSSENACLDHLRKTFKPSKKYCDPLDVFARWSAKIHMSYFGSVANEFFELLSKFTSSSDFMTKIIVWVAGPIFFGLLIITILKVLISSGFQGIFGFLSTSPTTTAKNNAFENLSTKIDAILTENLEIKRELSVLRECSVERQVKNSSSPRSKRRKLSSIKEARKHDDDESTDSP